MKGNFLGIPVIFLRQHWVKSEACGLLYTSAHFFQNVVSLLASIIVMLEHAHTRPHSRWANGFAKSKKTPVTGLIKNVLMLEFWWLKFDG